MPRFSLPQGEEIGVLFPGLDFGDGKRPRARPVTKFREPGPPVFGGQEAKGERKIFLRGRSFRLGPEGAKAGVQPDCS